MTTSLLQKLLLCQQEIPKPVKSSKNPHFKSQYANLEETIDCIVEVLNKHKLIIMQPINGDNLDTVVYDTESGESLKSSCRIVCINPSDPQKYGSGITYARRYSLLSLLCLATEDDDANMASKQVKNINYKATNSSLKLTDTHSRILKGLKSLKDGIIKGDPSVDEQRVKDTLWKSFFNTISYDNFIKSSEQELLGIAADIEEAVRNNNYESI